MGEIESIQGYWVHKDTGVKTYFDADADFITDGVMEYPPWVSDCSEVSIPVGVTSFVDYLFNHCSSLTSVTLPEGFTSLGRDIFYNCTSLASINIPEGVVSIGQDCFSGCSSLTSITLPESLTSLGMFCFIGCSSLTLATVLPATPPSLGWETFGSVHPSFNIKVPYPYVNDYKTSTNWIEYADIISAIDGYWVHKDTGVKTHFGLSEPSITNGIMGYPSWMPNCSEVKLPSGVTGFKTYNWVIEEWGNVNAAYTGFVHSKETYTAGNDILISIDLSNTSITSIPNSCFFDCLALTSITLPESLTSIEGDCFAGCESLTSITIPERVSSIGEFCFSDCFSLTLATVLPVTPPSLGDSVFGGAHTSFNIKVQSPYVNAYKAATNWKYYASKISAIAI